MGDVPGVVFPAGAIYDPDGDRLVVCYGAPHRVVAGCEVRMSHALAYLLECPEP